MGGVLHTQPSGHLQPDPLEERMLQSESRLPLLVGRDEYGMECGLRSPDPHSSPYRSSLEDSRESEQDLARDRW